jgi:hypothetical protein
MAAVPGATMTVGPISGSVYSKTGFLAANEYMRNDSGRYCTYDSSGNLALSTASSTQLDVWVYTCFQIIRDGNQGKTPYPTTASTSAGAYMVEATADIHTPANAIWMPVYTGETIALSNIGDLCDVAVIGSTTAQTQYVRPSVTTNKVLEILDVDLVNNYALVYARL